MNEFNILRNAIVDSLSEGKAIILTSYSSRDPEYYSFGGIHLVRNFDEIFANRADSIQFKALGASFLGNTRQNPGWKPWARYDSVGLRPEYIQYSVLFRVENPDFVTELEKVIEEYGEKDILVKNGHLRPYFLPMFILTLGEALSQGWIEPIFPQDETKLAEGAGHLLSF